LETQVREHLKSILSAARQVPRERRDDYLARACAADADGQALCAQVKALLQALDDAGEFLVDPPAVSQTLTGEQPRRAEGPLEDIGALVGPYKLLQRIGEGGFGVVYMAEQEQPVRRRVALKVIKLGMDTRQVIARFEAERQALTMMDHPNIARVLDAGSTVHGRPYFVMELVRGVPITRYCDDNRLTLPQRLDLFAQVCQAVQHAHAKGIIHRDLKPSNVLVTMNDERPLPKVIDFGIAKATGPKLTERTLFTEFAAIIGTPAYMSPEQAQMSALDVDTRGDVYSLGVLLYELLTGTTPFESEVLMQSGLAEMQRIIREVEPPRPSIRVCGWHTQAGWHGQAQRGRAATGAPEHGRAFGSAMASSSAVTVAQFRRTDPSTLIRSIRGELDWIVMKCLEKDRTRRYDTASGLAADVQRFLRDEPVLAGPPTAAYRLRKFLRRRRRWVVAACVFVLAVTLGMAGTIWQSLRARSAEREAVAMASTALAAQQSEADQRRLAVDRAERAEQLAYRLGLAAAESAIARGDHATARRALDSAPPPMRGFEWNYLQYESDRSERTLRIDLGPGDSSTVRCAISEDGRIAAAVRPGSTSIAFFDLMGGRSIRQLTAPAPLDHVTLAAQGASVIAGGADRTLHLLDAAGGRVLWQGAGHYRCVGNQMVVCSGNPATLTILDAASGSVTRTVAPQHAFAACAVYLTSDLRLAALVRSDYFDVLDLASGQVTWQGQGQALGFTPDDRWLLNVRLALPDSSVELLDAQTGETIESMPLRGRLAAHAVSADGSLALRTLGGPLNLFHVPTLEPMAALGTLPRADTVLSFADDGRLIAACGDGVRVYPPRVSPNPLRLPHGAGYSSAISPCGRYAASGEWGAVQMYDAATGTPLWCANPSLWFQFALAFSPDSRLVACQARRGTIALLDVQSGAMQRTFDCGIERGVLVNALAFSPDGSKLAAGFTDGKARIYTLAAPDTGPAIVLDAPSDELPERALGAVGGLAFSPDGARLATVSGLAVLDDGWTCHQRGVPGIVRVWRLDRPDRAVWEAGGAGNVLAFHPQDNVLLTGSLLTPLVVWDATSGARLAELVSTGDRPSALAFTPDGSRLAVGCAFGLQIWDGDAITASPEGPAPLVTIPTVASPDWLALQFSVDGKALVCSGGPSGIVRYDTVQPAHEVTRERAMTRSAMAVYRELLAGRPAPMLASNELVAKVQAHPSLDSALRQHAVACVRGLGEHVRVQLNLAAVCIQDHYRGYACDWTTALARAELAHRVWPDEPLTLLTLGQIYHFVDRHADAVATLRRADEVMRSLGFDDDVDLWATLAMAHHKLGQIAESQAALRHAREVSPGDAGAALKAAVQLVGGH